MRVLQVVTDDDRRGAQVFGLDLGHALAERGHAVDTVALAPGGVGGLDVPVLGDRRLGRPTLDALRRRARGVDVVVAHGSSTLPACLVSTTGLSTPYVYRQISQPLVWADTPAKRARVRLGLRRAAVVVALWSGSADVVASSFGVARSKLQIIPTGTPAARYPVVAPAGVPDARIQLGLVPGRPTVAFVGALVEGKGAELAVQAVSGRDAQLVVAGEGPLLADLRALATDLAPDQVVFTGALRHVQPVYAAADVVVLPSASESMPGVLIEAGLSGRVAVASPIDGIVEIVDDGRTGLLVAPESDAVRDAVGLLLDDPDRARAMGLAAHERCLERFDLDVVAQRWERCLLEVVSGGNAG